MPTNTLSRRRANNPHKTSPSIMPPGPPKAFGFGPSLTLHQMRHAQRAYLGPRHGILELSERSCETQRCLCRAGRASKRPVEQRPASVIHARNCVTDSFTLVSPRKRATHLQRQSFVGGKAIPLAVDILQCNPRDGPTRSMERQAEAVAEERFRFNGHRLQVGPRSPPIS